MAPRKNITKTPVLGQNAQQKLSKNKVKKEKPKLKTPTVIKIKIPGNNTSAIANKTVNNENIKTKRAKHSPVRVSMKFAERKVTMTRKLELANEVARAQLVKDEPVVFEPVPEQPKPVKPITNHVQPGPKKRGRKPKTCPIAGQKKVTNENKTSTEATDMQIDGKVEETKLEPRKKPKIIRKRPAPPKIVKDEVIKRRSLRVHKPTNREAETAMSPSPEKTDEKSKSTEFPCPGIIDSRKTSMTSTSECLSWTKEISSSSTTTCVTVTSSDFYCIDNKLPFVTLSNIDSQLKKTEKCKESSLSGSESDSSSSSSSSSGSSSAEVTSRSLNLSVSSISPMKPDAPQKDSPKHVSEIDKVLDKLSSKLKLLDMEMVNWIGYENENNDANIKKIQDKIFDVLKDESFIIAQCQHIKRILSNKTNENIPNNVSPVKNNVDFIKPVCLPIHKERKSSMERSRQSLEPEKHVIQNNENHDFTETPVVDNFTSDNVRYKSFDNNYDDDDAISIYAEAISLYDESIEPSRTNNSTVASIHNTALDFEEYIPEPVTHVPWSEVSYKPTKITEKSDAEPPVQTCRMKPICEKQNADSTSIYRENFDKKLAETFPFAVTRFNEPNKFPCTVTPAKTNPQLMSSVYKPSHGSRSVVFRDVCFYNLNSSCKIGRCRFPHIKLEAIEVKSRLTKLSEELFIQEYMLMRNWSDLRRDYGLCFVEESVRRDLMRITVEMAIDFVTKPNPSSNNTTAIIEVVECVLLYLNTKDLSFCEDLLTYKTKPNVLMCDAFMQAIADTQNFSRFRQVFTNLTHFITKLGRTFNIDVANHILERVGILPYEESIARALLVIIKNTDLSIINNPMLGQFEKQLCSSNKGLYEELLCLKEELSAKLSVPCASYTSPNVSQDEQMIINSLAMPVLDREKRYTSPDTTNLDNLNKTIEEPIVMINRAQLFGGNRQPSFTSSNASSEDGRPIRKFQHWRGGNVRNYSPVGSYLRTRPIRTRGTQRHVAYTDTTKYQRRTGPDYF